ncbi:Tim10/DDP family zinc finger-domain-containing protein [Blastocladiella britannica]|nr:Tim10/DDP family zinc finger-domain-containing protein [Blastocladiella britannica]
MSFLRSSPQQQYGMSPAVMAAEAEMEIMSDMFNRLGKLCHEKCIVGAYYEGTMTKGESVCTDRCVSKFFDVSYKVGKLLESRSKAQQQNQ